MPVFDVFVCTMPTMQRTGVALMHAMRCMGLDGLDGLDLTYVHSARALIIQSMVRYCDSLMSVYAVGMLGSLVGAAFFLLIAIKYKMPVSTTHSIVGGVVGVTVFGVGGSCLNPAFKGGLGGIMASWAISPLLSGLIGVLMYVTHTCGLLPPVLGAVNTMQSVRRGVALISCHHSVASTRVNPRQPAGTLPPSASSSTPQARAATP